MPHQLGEPWRAAGSLLPKGSEGVDAAGAAGGEPAGQGCGGGYDGDSQNREPGVARLEAHQDAA